jgi:hypothetical protein
MPKSITLALNADNGATKLQPKSKLAPITMKAAKMNPESQFCLPTMTLPQLTTQNTLTSTARIWKW